MHDLNLAAQFADKLIGLHGGKKIAAGPPEHVLTPANLNAMYGIEAEVTRGTRGQLQVFPIRAVNELAEMV
jgi:iron complex transport system ATP-binding protein